MYGFSLSANEKIIERYPWYNLGYLEIYEHICKEDKESANIYLHRAALRVYSRERLYNLYNSVVENEIEIEVAKEPVINDVPYVAPQIAVKEVEAVQEAVHKAINEIAHEVISEGASDVIKETTNEAVPEVTSEVTSEVAPELAAVKNNSSINENLEEIILGEIIDFVPDNLPRFVLAGGDYFSRKDFELVELDKSKPLDNFIAEKPTLLRSIVRDKKPESIEINEIDTSELFDDASFYTETLASIYTEQGFHKRALDVYGKLILLYPEKSSYFATLVKEIKEKHKL